MDLLICLVFRSRMRMLSILVSLTLLVDLRKRCLIIFKKKVAKKTRGWKEKLLLQEGKEVFIKYVLQSIPKYAMSIFLLPKSLCDEVTTMIRKLVGWERWTGEV